MLSRYGIGDLDYGVVGRQHLTCKKQIQGIIAIDPQNIANARADTVHETRAPSASQMLTAPVDDIAA